MEPVRELRRKYCPPALFIAILIAVILVFAGYRDMARGLVLGTLFSIVNFVLMGLSLQRRMQKTRRASTVVSFLLILVRFGVLMVPLLASIYYDRFHIVTTIAGLFMVQAVMLADAVGKMVTSRKT